MAQCLDVRRERLREHDRVLLDTNVILDVADPAISQEANERQIAYQQFIQLALNGGATILVSVLSLYEIASVLESNAFRRTSATPFDRSELKRFRAIPAERARVLADITNTWRQITTVADVLDAPLLGVAEESLSLMNRTRLDGYDVPIVISAKAAGVTSIVTEDADYATASGLIIYTANRKMLVS